MDFDDMNPPTQHSEAGDIFFGCLTWLLIIGAAVLLWNFIK